MCGGFVLNVDLCVYSNQMLVLSILKGVNARTKNPNVVLISASNAKRKATQICCKQPLETVESDTTIQKSKSFYKELYVNTNQEWKCRLAKRCLSGSNLSNVPSSSNSLADCTTHPIHVDSGYLIQGNVTIKRVYYVEGLNHNLFSVGQFCDADLEVAFRKSTCFVRDLQGNDLLMDETRGTEFLNKTLHAYFKEEGIEHQTSTPRTPEQNGVVERRNRTLVEAARMMLSAFKLPLSFWAEAVATACYTQNRAIIISTHGKTAYQI
ncbi:retrovirus-related pol polyprotein from transposon TNT 1-94 [Tanacetum coccineum]|uniref:Retrovirus-related pol polyprotein from transposon TNT 1-94 n=1 Tax=Tanacetum coccineum TaxID=301880 RepID=A0ABQ5E3K4_9ASTR